jgi:hypothetical protein
VPRKSQKQVRTHGACAGADAPSWLETRALRQ